ncbi:hypothetical protein [Terrisporobacter sp.]|uniref:hypothetical protein n=1 Tax=Terrisporobacter sp. TaxID=1965305 RepID=UPI00289A48F2|nr:hypothetical protein [Terrisporobacter sp.]
MKGCDKLQELINRYNSLQRLVYNVVQENRCRDGDVDIYDMLENAEESFSIELLDFLTELNESEGLGEV